MKQEFYHYEKWEDWKAGLYDKCSDEFDQMCRSFNLLCNPGILYVAMRRVVRECPVATKQNLTNRSINRQAWLGQAACCLNHGASADVTIHGWRLMISRAQDEANRVADQVIEKFEDEYYHSQDIKSEYGLCQSDI